MCGIFLSGVLMAMTLSGSASEKMALSSDVVTSWPESDINIGQATGVAVDSHNHVFVFHRASREWKGPLPETPISEATIAMLDADTGVQLSEWGGDMFGMPHGLSIDTDDNIWVTDVINQQVYKFSHDGELLLTLGEYRTMGTGPGQFGRPTDVAFTSAGNILISDGYVNTRIVSYSRDGVEQGSWTSGEEDKHAFDLPHGIAVTRDDRILVVDRGNARIQVRNVNGEFLEDWKSKEIGWPYGIAVAPSGDIWVIDGGKQPNKTRARVLQLSDVGEVLQAFSAAAADDEATLGHDIAIGMDGAVYTVDAWGGYVRKFLPRTEPQPTAETN